MLKKATADNAELKVEETAGEREDHRTIIGRRRRANTETKIIHAAVRVFAEQGPDAPVIEDFIRAAGIGRGTFYRYFKSVDELLRATSELLGEELVESIEKDLQHLKDPALRFGMGLRLWMRWAHSNPSWCLFIAKIWKSVTYERPLRDIREGIRRKRFFAPDAYVAFDVISGAIRQTMFMIGEGNVGRSYGDGVVEMCLHALRVSPETMTEILSLPLPEIGEK